MATTTSTKSRPRQRRTSSTSRQTGEQRAASSGTSAQTSGMTLNLPFVTARFHAPDMHLPSRQDVTAAASSAAETVRAQLPSRGQAVFYGALGLGAALSMIEWPVALAIGVGNALIEREMHEHKHNGSSSG
ncbi:hypothetical protein [Saccharopolyspora taberi]|uniref:Uncharacterized protein n=1 Tax=Saccharopolyspora taberi TaxID=60895 RepID=A0ABN3VDR7_9PSEU